MNLTIRQIRYLYETGRLGGIQAASRSLNISQSSISAALDRAEAALGARIFERRPSRGVVVTPAGERFLAAARTLLSAEEEFARRIDALASSTPRVVRVGCFQPFGPLFMTALLRRYLEAIGPTDLVLMEGDQRQLSAWLSNGEIDFVVTYATGQVFAEATPICSVPPHAVLHRDDPLANLPAVAPADLAARPFVLLDLPETAPFLTAVFDRRTPPRIVFRSQNYETVRSAVAVGLGVSVLNLRPFGEAALDPPTLVRRPLTGAPEPLTLVVADIYQGLKPHFVSVFIEETRRFFEEAGPERYAVA